MDTENSEVLAKLHRAKLSPVDKALLKLGVIDEFSRVTPSGEKVIIGFLMTKEGFKEELDEYLAPLRGKMKGEQTAS